MKNEKNKSGYNVTIIILTVVITLIVLALIYLLFIKKDGSQASNDQSDNWKQNITTELDDSNLTPWVKYLLSQNIKKVGYYDNDVWKDISHEQLRDYLKKLTSDYSLYKIHDFDGGCSGYCGLEIEYNNVKLNIYNGSIFFENDSTLLSLLENSKYTLNDKRSSYNTWHFAYYRNPQNDSFETLEVNEYINSK